jgi:DNA polymerase-3 subunit alpha
VPKIKALVADAKAKDYTAIALTDEDSGSGLIEFYEECKKQDIKPVLGATLRIPNLDNPNEFSKIAILAKNQQGYLDLLSFISTARTINEEPKYHLTFADIKSKIKPNNNFFILICGNNHELVAELKSQGGKAKAKKILQAYTTAFGASNLLVELALPVFEESSKQILEVNQKLVDLCQEFNLKYLASPAPRYLEKTQKEVFSVILAVRNQQKLYDIALERDFDLPTLQQLTSNFSNFPKALDTTEIEAQIDIQLKTDYDQTASDAFFPKFALEQDQNAPDRLTWETYTGLLAKFDPSQKTQEQWQIEYPYQKLSKLKEYAKNLKPDTTKLLSYPLDYWEKHTIEEYINRIDYELGIIINKGYPDYFLVCADIMGFCRDKKIVTNVRGSVAGSLVTYLTNISVFDPLIYNVPFERFLNPERPSPPDIDGDFADDRRDEVIQYICQKYGFNQVSQIITFGTMLPRAAVRDVGRVLGISYNKCDRLSKLIPNAPQGRKTTFEWAFNTSQELKEAYEKDEDSRRIIDICKQIEGNYRHASVHAAGLLIAPTPLTDYVPTQWDADHKIIISQYDMRISEKVGMVKFDILGIRGLSILGKALELTEQRRGQYINLLNIDIHNQKTFDMLSKGRTIGVFQLSSPAMTKYLTQLEPNRVQDLMAMVALYRPGPMGIIPDYIARKKDHKKIKFLDEKMRSFMEQSYGLFVYQEDVIYTAVELAGYSMGEADNLRRGMGKKKQAVIDAEKPKFIEGCVKNGIKQEKAEHIWDLIVPFSAYGFNKAHSASYGIVAYWTAYMKANYPAEYMTAYLTSESGNLVKISEAIKESKELDLEIKPPDVNISGDGYSIESDTTVRYGFGSVKNLGTDVVKFIVQERESNGAFQNLEDFFKRVSKYPQFNKRSLEALIDSGSLDELGAKTLI